MTANCNCTSRLMMMTLSHAGKEGEEESVFSFRHPQKTSSTRTKIGDRTECVSSLQLANLNFTISQPASRQLLSRNRHPCTNSVDAVGTNYHTTSVMQNKK